MSPYTCTIPRAIRLGRFFSYIHTATRSKQVTSLRLTTVAFMFTHHCRSCSPAMFSLDGYIVVEASAGERIADMQCIKHPDRPADSELSAAIILKEVAVSKRKL